LADARAEAIAAGPDLSIRESNYAGARSLIVAAAAA
jgi:hypothetical protein